MTELSAAVMKRRLGHVSDESDGSVARIDPGRLCRALQLRRPENATLPVSQATCVARIVPRAIWSAVNLPSSRTVAWRLPPAAIRKR